MTSSELQSEIAEYVATYEVKKISLDGVELDLTQYAKAEDVTQLKGEFGNLEEHVESEITDVKAQIIQQTPLFANSIEELEESGDTTKVYVLPDGYIYAYSTTILSEGSVEVTESITGDFSENTRLSTSDGSEKTLSGFVTTPFIDVSSYPADAEIHLSGIEWNGGSDMTTGYSFSVYDKSKVCLEAGYIYGSKQRSETYNLYITSNSITDVVITPKTAGTKFDFSSIRFSGKGISSDAVVQIVYTEKTDDTTVSTWGNTGRAFVPADYEPRIIELEESATDQEERLSAIESLNAEGVPDYVLEGAEKVVDKVLAVRDDQSLVLGKIGDFHTTGADTSATGVLHAGMAVNEIHSMTRLDALLLFGDIAVVKFDDTYKEGFKYVRKCFSNVTKNVPLIHMQGNHDELSTDTTEEARQKYFAYIGANNVGCTTDPENKFRNYGYRDFEDQKIRVIYLNTVDVSESDNTEDAYVTAQQLLWFANTALDFSEKSDPEKWSFTVNSHHPLNWHGNIPNILTILDAYKGKTSGSITLDNVIISYDFTSVVAEFIAHFHGHLHNFRTESLGTNGILSITIPNACYGRNNEYGTYEGYSDEVHELYGDTDSEGNQRQFNKTSGTVEDTAFNIVVIRKDSRMIYCFNYGAGIDRVITFDGELAE